VPEDDHDHGYDGQEGDEALQMMLSVNVLDVDPDDLDYQGRSAPRTSAVGLFEPPGERMRRHNLTCKLESSVFECLRCVRGVKWVSVLFCVCCSEICGEITRSVDSRGLRGALPLPPLPLLGFENKHGATC